MSQEPPNQPPLPLSRPPGGTIQADPGMDTPLGLVAPALVPAAVIAAPIARPDSGLTTADGRLLRIPVARLLANDTAPGRNTLRITGVRLANPAPPGTPGAPSVRLENGFVIYDPGRQIPWPLIKGTRFTDSFLYDISDGNGGTATAAAAVTIQRPLGAPARPGLIAPPGLRLVQRLAGSPRADLLRGGALRDRLEGRAGADELRGEGGQDDLFGGAGDDRIFGGAGLDTAYYSGSVFDHIIERRAGGAIIRDRRADGDGTDTVDGVEQLAFRDRIVYLTGANNAPIARPDSATVTYGQSLRIPIQTLLANDVDFDGDQLHISHVKDAVLDGQDVVYTPAGTVQWALVKGASIKDSFQYEVSDGHGGTDVQTVMVTILRPGQGRQPPAIPAGVPRPRPDSPGNTALPGGDQNGAIVAAASESLWPDNPTPSVISDPDTGPVELGVKFRASQNGQITGIRFYKGAQNTGTHTGTLWSATGANLGTLTFSNETASGWQSASFANPIPITANTTYVASYFAPNGRYSVDENHFTAAHTSGSLTALANGTEGGNGVYRYSSTSAFPNLSYAASNYWVDVLFQPSGTAPNSPPLAKADSGFSTPLNTSLRIAAAQLLANDSDPDGDPLSLTGVSAASGGTVALDTAANEVVFTPTSSYSGPASFSYTIADGRGGTATANVSLSVGTAPIQTLWPNSATPAAVTINDTSPVELGVKFRASQNGQITGIRFYKGPQNTGTHTGTLWTASGSKLGTLTFSGETASGWQQANFASPIPITANTTYVASYFAPNSHYSADGNYFTTARTSGSLTALANGSDGGNGVYAYSGASTFPAFTYNGTNYWVDVMFQPSGGGANTPPLAAADSGSTDEDTPITLNVLANDADPDGDPLQVSSLDLTGTLGAVQINANNTISYDPRAAFQALAAGQTATDSFAYTVSDGKGGTASANVTVTVTGRNDAVNAIALENAKPGNPQSEWGINGNGDVNIEGYATDISVNQGETVHFKVNTDATDYRLDIYRVGYYGGMGARKVATVEPSLILPGGQPAPITDAATGLVDAGNWRETASWAVPSDAVSGVYIAKLVREDGTPGNNHIYFVVRDDGGGSDLLFQTSDTTWEAYNSWGGNSFYTGSPAGRAYKVSYNRPFGSPGNSVNRPLMDAEYPMIRWLEANGYDVSYSSALDTSRRGAELLDHKAFLSVGHDEYWSGQQRANVEQARDAGVNLGFFSGNESYWKTRWEPSIDGSNTPDRTLVTYKETWANAKIDPSSAWTGTWRDPRFSPPSDGGRPENQLSGTIFSVDSYRLDTIGVPAEDGKMRFWRNTDIATLAPGQTANLTPNVLGYEWDEDLDNGFRPLGGIDLSSTTLDVGQYVSNYGNTVGPGTATHNLTLYRAPSGALVFGSGTTRWSWGLDSDHINETSTVDPRMRQATVNLFADMGVQPLTLQPGLQPATASTDTTAPTSLIQTPSGGTTVGVGDSVTVSGTASDVGGIVGAVEVSADNGTTWRRANGRANWSYTWRPETTGTVTLRSRAIDDSLNVGTPSTGVSVQVNPSVAPWSLWTASVTPSLSSADDANPVELGVKFRSDINGSVTGLRFYKGSQNTGTHTGNLWSATGAKLGTVTFTGETASGWQQANFASPIPITANTTYVASYFAPNGHYSADSGYFQTNGVRSGPLAALASPDAGGNGVYAYGTASKFPTDSWNGTNYWVDVVMTDTPTA